MPLTAKAIDASKPRDKPFKLSDGAGLYLYIAPTGLRSWRANYRADGKQKTRTYGTYPGLSLAEARRAHANAQVAVDAPKSTPTFRAVATDWMMHYVPTLKNAKQRARVPVLFDDYVFPTIGDRPIDELKRAELVSVVKAIAARGIIETATRVGGRITAVLDYAQDQGIIETHPGNNLSRVAPPAPPVKHMPCIAVSEAPALLRAIDTYGDPVTRLALLTAACTFVRVQELLGMRQSEVHGDLWVIPEKRMKRPRPHVVPLASQVLTTIKAAAAHSTGDLVFEGARGRPLSENTLLFALYRLGYRGRMTVHGFRSLASTVLNEHGFPPDVIERQLAHRESDAVRAAYNRADYLPQRREMMQWWAQKIDQWRASPVAVSTSA